MSASTVATITKIEIENVDIEMSKDCTNRSPIIMRHGAAFRPWQLIKLHHRN